MDLIIVRYADLNVHRVYSDQLDYLRKILSFILMALFWIGSTHNLLSVIVDMTRPSLYQIRELEMSVISLTYVFGQCVCSIVELRT